MTKAMAMGEPERVILCPWTIFQIPDTYLHTFLFYLFYISFGEAYIVVFVVSSMVLLSHATRTHSHTVQCVVHSNNAVAVAVHFNSFIWFVRYSSVSLSHN